MSTYAKTFLWLLLAVGSGATGFYFGIRKGSDVIGTIAAQNNVSDALGHIDSSLVAIDRNSLAYSQARHQLEFRSAVYQLGINAEHVGYWRCSERDRRIVASAGSYLATHPIEEDPFTASAVAKALKFCGRQENP